MAEYEVLYKINVVAAEAISSIRSFSEAANGLNAAVEAVKSFNASIEAMSSQTAKITALATQLTSLNAALRELGAVSVNIDTTRAKQQLSELAGVAKTVKKTVAQAMTMPVGTGAAPARSGWMSMASHANRWSVKGAPSSTLPINHPYREWLRMQNYLTIQERWNERLAAKNAKVLAERRKQYLQSNRDEIYSRHKDPFQFNNRTYSGMFDGTSYAPVGNPVYQNSMASGRKFTPSRYAGMNNGYKPVIWPAKTKNLWYELFGHNQLPNNGGMAIDMLKGMGIAYGIAGIGGLISDVVSQSTEYNNLITTVRNILQTHDSRPDFIERFKEMEYTVRRIGVETKFTVTEVADAAKFLAMAGLGLEDINQSMKPIADISLIGDTDLGTTADVVTNIMTAYNMKAAEMRQAADIMTNTFTMSNTTLMEIAEAYKYSAAILSAGGVDFSESTAAIGVLGDAGIKASMAGTTLRTIMANIVNPTKKQRSAWQDIGITTKGKSLIQIFQELNAKNLEVASFYRLFHKTAAQGAVALAAHVDKWIDIKYENDFSEGLSRSLAERKKGTIQGLWAQVTSAFTDQGVTAFTSVEATIKSTLKNTTDWLRNNSLPIFQKVTDSIMELGRIIKTNLNFLGMFFNNFGGLIMMWAKFSLMVWPVVKAFGALKTIWLTLQGARAVSMGIGGVFGTIRNIYRDATFTGVAKDGSMVNSIKGQRERAAIMSPGVLPFLPGVTADQMKNAKRGLRRFNRPHYKVPDYSKAGYFVSEAEAARMGPAQLQLARDWNKSVEEERKRLNNLSIEKARRNRAEWIRDRQRYYRRIAGYQFLNGAKSIGGMALGGLGLGMGVSLATDEESNGLTKGAGLFYSIAGISAMIGGPWGWAIAGVSAATGGILQLCGSIKKAEEAMEQLIATSKRLRVVNGITSNADDPTQKYFEYIYTKNKDINQLVEYRIQLTKQLLGLQSENSTQADSMFKSTFKQMQDDYMQFWRMGNRSDLLEVLSSMASSILGKDTEAKSHEYGNKYYISEFGNINGEMLYPNDNAMLASIVAADILNKTLKPQLVESFTSAVNKMSATGTSYDEILEYANSFLETYSPANPKNKIIYPANIDKEDLSWSIDRMKQDYFAMYVLHSNLKKFVDEMLSQVKGYADYRTAKGNNGAANLTPITQDEIISIVTSRPEVAGAVAETYKRYLDEQGNLKTDEWLKSYGLYGGKFHPANGNTAENVMKIALKNAIAFLTTLEKLEVASEAAAKPIIEAHNRLMSQAIIQMGLVNNGKIDQEGNLEDGATANVDGITYRYDKKSGLWKAPTPTGKRPLSATEMAAELAGDDLNDDPFGTGAPSPSAYNNEYKSNYRNNSAAPKQVIVNIENLMNVESVDLSKPDNQMAVADIKQQLTQALVDVVHDFDVTYS